MDDGVAGTRVKEENTNSLLCLRVVFCSGWWGRGG